MTSRTEPPDVPAVPAPLVGALLAAADAFGARVFDVLGFQARVLELLQALPPREALASHVARAMDERRSQVLSRRRQPGRQDEIQITYFAEGEAHPCHCHNNVVSTQVVLAGCLDAREFDRVGTARRGAVLLRLLFDGRLRPGDYVQTREAARNAHWYAAAPGPTALLEITLLGYERETFYAPGERPLGRVLLDPTEAAGQGLLLGQPIAEAEAEARFGRGPLSGHSLPVPPAETTALRLEPA